jgi:hypothetical protein
MMMMTTMMTTAKKMKKRQQQPKLERVPVLPEWQQRQPWQSWV